MHALRVFCSSQLEIDSEVRILQFISYVYLHLSVEKKFYQYQKDMIVITAFWFTNQSLIHQIFVGAIHYLHLHLWYLYAFSQDTPSPPCRLKMSYQSGFHVLSPRPPATASPVEPSHYLEHQAQLAQDNCRARPLRPLHTCNNLGSPQAMPSF